MHLEEHDILLRDPGLADGLGCDWSTLSEELVAEVCQWLLPSSVAAVRQTCTTWKAGASQAVAGVSLGLPGGCRAHVPYGLLPCDTAAATNSLWPVTGSLDTGEFAASVAYHRNQLPGAPGGARMAPADSSHFHGPSASHEVMLEHSPGTAAAASATVAVQHAGVHQHCENQGIGQAVHSLGARDGAASLNTAAMAPAHQEEHANPCTLMVPCTVPAAAIAPPAAAPALLGQARIQQTHKDEPDAATEVPFQMSFGGLLHVGPQPPPQVLCPNRSWSCRDASARVHAAFPCANKLLISIWPAAYMAGGNANGDAGGLGATAMQERARDLRDALQLLCSPHVAALTLLGDVPQHLLCTSLPLADLALAPLGGSAPAGGPLVGAGTCAAPQSSAPRHAHYPCLGLSAAVGLAQGDGVGIVEETEDADEDELGAAGSGANAQGLLEEGQEEGDVGAGHMTGPGAGGDCQPMDLDTSRRSSNPTLTAEEQLRTTHTWSETPHAAHGAPCMAHKQQRQLPPLGWGAMGSGPASASGAAVNQASNSLAMHHSSNGDAGSGGGGSGSGGSGTAHHAQQQGPPQPTLPTTAHEGSGSGPSGSHGSGGSGGTHAAPAAASHGDGSAGQGAEGCGYGGSKGYEGVRPVAGGSSGADTAQGSGGDNSGGDGSNGDGRSNGKQGSNGCGHSGGKACCGKSCCELQQGSDQNGSGNNGSGNNGSGNNDSGTAHGGNSSGSAPQPHGCHSSHGSGGSTQDRAGLQSPTNPLHITSHGAAAAAAGALQKVPGQGSAGAPIVTDVTDFSLPNGGGCSAQTCVRMSAGGASAPGSSSHGMKSGGSGSGDQNGSGNGSGGNKGCNAAKAITATAPHMPKGGASAVRVRRAPPATDPAALARAGQPQQLAAGLLPGLTNLRELRLWDCRGLPTPDTLAALTALSHLRLLDVRPLRGVSADTGEVLRHRRSPAITDEHLAVLGSLTSLTGLHLSHVTHVTGTGLAHLHRLTGLEALSLGSALDAHAVSGADLTALGNALPRLHSLHIGCLAAAHQLLDVGLAFVQPPPIAVLGATAGKQPGSRRGHHAGPPVPPNGALLGVTAALPLGGLAALAPPPVAHGELKAWGACLTHFSALHTLGLQLTSSLEPELLGSLRFLDNLRLLDLEGVDLPYGEILALLDCATGLQGLRRLSLSEVVLYDAHLAAMGRLTQLRALTLAQVDVRTRDLCGWTSLAPLTSLRSFEFEEWNNPVLSVGNLVVLTDESVCVMAGSWRGLEQLRYAGQVVLTAAAREALSGLPHLSHLLIQGTDGTQCIGSRGNSSGQGLGADGSGGAGGSGNNARGDGRTRGDNVPVVLQACVGSAVLPAGCGTSNTPASTTPPSWLVHSGVLAAGTGAGAGMGRMTGPAQGHQQPQPGEDPMQGGGRAAATNTVPQLGCLGSTGPFATLQAAAGLTSMGASRSHIAQPPPAGAAGLTGAMPCRVSPLDPRKQSQGVECAALPAAEAPAAQDGSRPDACSMQPSNPLMSCPTLPTYSQQLAAAVCAVPATSQSTPQPHLQTATQPRGTRSGAHHTGHNPGLCAHDSTNQQGLAEANSPRASSPACHLPAAATRSGGHVGHARGGEAGGGGRGGGLQVCLLLPHKLSSCNGYLTHSGTPSLNGSQGSEESVNWPGPDADDDDGCGGGGQRGGQHGTTLVASGEEGEVQGRERVQQAMQTRGRGRAHKHGREQEPQVVHPGLDLKHARYG